MTEAEVSQFTSLPVARLYPSPDNPRKHIDQAALEQLAANIKEHGVISPLVVRPTFPGWDARDRAGSTPNAFEIVSGERRWRASQLAGLAEVPVRILQLSDAAALEVQVIENLQRADIHELEEADGYKALQDRYGYSVEDLAAKVGKSIGYIYGRLKLTALVDEKAREAFFSGTIAPSVALFIARLAPKLQAEATQAVLTGGWDDGERAPFTTREALNHLRRKYSLKLSDAKFSLESEELVPAAGPCTTCPKRSGNAPTLFATETPDVCTDPPCHSAKTKRHFELLIEDARATGRVVIEGKKAKAVFPYEGSEGIGQGYIRPDAREWSDDGKQHKPWSERLGKHLPVPALAVHPKTHEVVEVITLEELKAAKKAAGIKSHDRAEATKPKVDADQAAAEKKQREREQAKREERIERTKAVAAAAIGKICDAVMNGQSSRMDAALAFVLASHPAGRLALVDAGVLAATDRDEIFAYDRVVAKAVERLAARDIAGMLIRASLYDDAEPGDRNVPGVDMYLGEYTPSLKALVGIFGDVVSLKALEKEATNRRLKDAAIEAERGKADAAITASANKPKPVKAPLGKPNTAMAVALSNAKPVAAKKKPAAKAKK